MSCEKIIEAMARAMAEADDWSWGLSEVRYEYTEHAKAALSAAEAEGMRFIGPDEAVVPRVLTPEMGRAIENAPVGLIEGEPHDVWQSEWTAALAAAEAGDG